MIIWNILITYNFIIKIFTLLLLYFRKIRNILNNAAYRAEAVKRQIDKFTRHDLRRITSHGDHQDKITSFFIRQAIPIDRAASSIYFAPLLCKVEQVHVSVGS